MSAFSKSMVGITSFSGKNGIRMRSVVLAVLTVVVMIFFVSVLAAQNGNGNKGSDNSGETFSSKKYNCSFTMPSDNWGRTEDMAVVPNGLVEYIHKKSFAILTFFVSEEKRKPRSAMDEIVSQIKNRSKGLKLLQEQTVRKGKLQGIIRTIHFINAYGLGYNAALVVLNGEKAQYRFLLFSLASSYENTKSLLMGILKTFKVEE